MSKPKPTRSLRHSPARNVAPKSNSPSYQPSFTERFLLKTDDVSYEQPMQSPTFKFAHNDSNPKNDPLTKYLNISYSAKNERGSSLSLIKGNNRPSNGYSSPSLNHLPKKVVYSSRKTEISSITGLNSTAESLYRDELNRVLDENSSIRHKLEAMEDREQVYSEKIQYLEKENQRLQFQVMQKDQVISDLASQMLATANKMSTNSLNHQNDTERYFANLETKGKDELIKPKLETDTGMKNDPTKLMVSKATQVNWTEKTPNECQKCSLFAEECEIAWLKLSEFEQTWTQMIENNFKLKLEYDDYKQNIEDMGAKTTKNETELKVQLDDRNIVSQELKSEVKAIRSFIKQLLFNPTARIKIKNDNQNKQRKSAQKVSETLLMTQNIKESDHFPAFLKAVSLGSTLAKKDKL